MSTATAIFLCIFCFVLRHELDNLEFQALLRRHHPYVPEPTPLAVLQEKWDRIDRKHAAERAAERAAAKPPHVTVEDYLLHSIYSSER